MSSGVVIGAFEVMGKERVKEKKKKNKPKNRQIPNL